MTRRRMIDRKFREARRPRGTAKRAADDQSDDERPGLGDPARSSRCSGAAPSSSSRSRFETVAPFTLVLIRVVLAAAMLWAFLLVRRERLPHAAGRRARPSWCWPCSTTSIPFVLFAWAQEAITGGLASILNATTPIWGVIVAHLFTADEKATPGKVAGVLLGFAGVAVMIGADLLGEIGADALAQLACLVATLCYALAGVWARRFRGDGGDAGRGLDRPAHRRRARDAAAGAALRAALAGRARPRPRPGSALARPGPVLHQPRLHPLFPAARLGRRDQLAARHLPDPDHRDPARRADPRRAAGAAPFRRHGADRRRPRGDRRAAVQRRRRL